jgi:hypothetical protein
MSTVFIYRSVHPVITKTILVQTGAGREGCRSFEAASISRQSAHEGGKVVSRTHRPPLPHRKYTWYSFLMEAESNPGP